MAEVAGHYLDRGTRISRYEVVAVIGAGGFGITYKAYDTRLLCEVAMKEYLPVELAARGSDQSTVLPRSQDVTEEYRHGLTRFLDEARVLAKFKNRHIVRVSDFMEVNGTAYLVMDYEEGQSLAELLKQRGGPLSEVEIKNIFIPILDGLKAVHDAGLLHRDIKPDNIYLRKHGPPVLLDFGAARQYAASQTRGLTAIVTPGYAPFEQYQPNAELGAWSDLYAVGATMYACITGSPPVDAITRHPGVKVDPLPPAVEVGGDRYSEVLLRSIDWMLRPAANE
ncbi:MAG: serine/threonine-protein kinase, partial [Arenicellales bacterium]